MSTILTINDISNYIHSHIVECSLLVILLCAFIHQIYFYLRYILKGCKTKEAQEDTSFLNKELQPGVSVVVCARNEQENLQNYLHILLNQHYPCYEVIVVNDSSDDNTQLILEQYAHQYANLYITFVPQGARVISSKKLALTIGIKAAHYDYILLTDADCRPESRYWIQKMMQGFRSESTEVVLGFSPYFENDSWISRLISYDTLFSGLQYMGMAKSGHPYMGVGRNLAYRKSTFFANNGFQGLLNERAGDDDLFVNKVATKQNTVVVNNSDSLTWSAPKHTWYDWVHQKRRHLSVSSYYNTCNKIRIGAEPLSRGITYALTLCLLLYGGYAGVCAMGLLTIRLILQLGVINYASSKLRIRKFGLNIIIYDIILPLITLYILITKPLYAKRLYW